MAKYKPPGTPRAVALVREIQAELAFLREDDHTCDRSWSRILELTEELSGLIESAVRDPTPDATVQRHVLGLGRDVAVAVAVELIRMMVTRACGRPRTSRRKIDDGGSQPGRRNQTIQGFGGPVPEGVGRAA